MYRTIMISGANRGIGRAIAERALKDGHKISLGIRDPQKLEEKILDLFPIISAGFQSAISEKILC